MSTFPTSLDNLSESHADGTAEVIHASTINDLATAVNAIETTAQFGLGIQYRDVQILHDQILTLPTVEVELVPAPGDGYAIYAPSLYGFGGGVLRLDWHADYTNVDPGAQLRIALEGDSVLLDYPAAADFVAWGVGGEFVPYWPLGVNTAAGTGQVDRSTVNNKALVMRITNGGLGNFTGGDPANTMNARFWYSIVPTPVGT